LAACYQNSLRLAAEHGLKSISFPAISTGVYGYPMSEAAAVSSRAIEQFLGGDMTIDQVRLIFFSAADAEVFLKHQVFTGKKGSGPEA
jgi:O-acetyl-ADP-ribose deacetylase (regulator of RNase III)